MQAQLFLLVGAYTVFFGDCVSLFSDDVDVVVPGLAESLSEGEVGAIHKVSFTN